MTDNLNRYDPPDLHKSDIVEVLRYEARFAEVAAAIGDETTEEFTLMCLTAAAEIERLRDELQKLRGKGNG